MKSASSLHLFDPLDVVTPGRIIRWYENIALELDAGFLSPEERAYMRSYYAEVGLLRPWRRSFFLNHFAPAFAAAATYLLDGRHGRTFVDLGSGTGTQALALALLGARVIALDGDETAARILRKRMRFYESVTARALNITVATTSALEYDYSDCAPIAGIWSLFAFNLMQPSSMLLDHIIPHCSPQARVAIQDGNRLSWLGRLPGRRRSVWSPVELDRALCARGFRRDRLRGAAALPPVAWLMLPEALLATIEGALLGSWAFALSYLALYEREAPPSGMPGQ